MSLQRCYATGDLGKCTTGVGHIRLRCHHRARSHGSFQSGSASRDFVPYRRHLTHETDIYNVWTARNPILEFRSKRSILSHGKTRNLHASAARGLISQLKSQGSSVDARLGNKSKPKTPASSQVNSEVSYKESSNLSKQIQERVKELRVENNQLKAKQEELQKFKDNADKIVKGKVAEEKKKLENNMAKNMAETEAKMRREHAKEKAQLEEQVKQLEKSKAAESGKHKQREGELEAKGRESHETIVSYGRRITNLETDLKLSTQQKEASKRAYEKREQTDRETIRRLEDDNKGLQETAVVRNRDSLLKVLTDRDFDLGKMEYQLAEMSVKMKDANSELNRQKNTLEIMTPKAAKHDKYLKEQDFVEQARKNRASARQTYAGLKQPFVSLNDTMLGTLKSLFGKRDFKRGFGSDDNLNVYWIWARDAFDHFRRRINASDAQGRNNIVLYAAIGRKIDAARGVQEYNLIKLREVLSQNVALYQHCGFVAHHARTATRQLRYRDASTPMWVAIFIYSNLTYSNAMEGLFAVTSKDLSATLRGDRQSFGAFTADRERWAPILSRRRWRQLYFWLQFSPPAERISCLRTMFGKSHIVMRDWEIIKEELEPHPSVQQRLERLLNDVGLLDMVEARSWAVAALVNSRRLVQESEGAANSSERTRFDAALRANWNQIMKRVKYIEAGTRSPEQLRSDQAESEEPDSQPAESDQMQLQPAESEMAESKQRESETTKLEQNKSEQVDSRQGDSERVDAEQVKPKQAEVEPVASEQARSDEIKTSQSETELNASEKLDQSEPQISPSKQAESGVPEIEHTKDEQAKSVPLRAETSAEHHSDSEQPETEPLDCDQPDQESETHVPNILGPQKPVGPKERIVPRTHLTLTTNGTEQTSHQVAETDDGKSRTQSDSQLVREPQLGSDGQLIRRIPVRDSAAWLGAQLVSQSDDPQPSPAREPSAGRRGRKRRGFREQDVAQEVRIRRVIDAQRGSAERLSTDKAVSETYSTWASEWQASRDTLGLARPESSASSPVNSQRMTAIPNIVRSRGPGSWALRRTRSRSVQARSYSATAAANAQMDFRIPPDVLLAAKDNLQAGSEVYWTHEMYRSTNGDRVKVRYCVNVDVCEKLISIFADEPVIGFDMEWETGAGATNGIKDNVSVIQLASEHSVALFHVARFRGESAQDLMPPTLRTILESDSIIKAGVNIAGDFTRLRRCFGIDGKGILELSHIYKLVRYSADQPHLVNRSAASMSEQVQYVWGLPLNKGDVRVSSWARQLSSEQARYAATDAYAGFQLFHELEKKREAMQPAPPRPAFQESGLPLILGNGLPPPPRIPSKRVKVEEVMEDFKEASKLEVWDENKEMPSTPAASVDLAAVASTYPPGQAVIPRDVDSISEDHNDSPSSHGATDPAEADTTFDSVDSEHSDIRFEAADAWIIEYRRNRTSTRGTLPSQQALRAYALWHQHSLSISETAELLRQPPLSPSTVNSYILQAVAGDKNLPFAADRMRAVVEALPRSAILPFKSLMLRLDAL